MLNHVSEYHYSIPLITPIHYQLFGREINVQILGCSTVLADYRRKEKHLPKRCHLQIASSVAAFNTDLFLLHLISFIIIPITLEYDSFTSLNLEYSDTVWPFGISYRMPREKSFQQGTITIASWQYSPFPPGWC